MFDIMSKNARPSVNHFKCFFGNGNSTDLESLYGTHDVNDDQHVYLDPNLASIISNAVAKIKSKQLKKPPKRKRACKYPCSVCEKKMSMLIRKV